MADQDQLALRFEQDRRHLRAVAFRILGSLSDAEDAVQEAWLRLSRADTSAVNNLSGWLTTVVARVSLSMLQSRKSLREDPLDSHPPQERTGPAGDTQSRGPVNPEDEALLADSIGAALLIVLDTLEPRERLAFVLHDMFAVPYDEIGPIVGSSPVSARQLASRARRRVQRGDTGFGAQRARQREIVDAFLAAARSGQFDALLTLLDPDVVLRADEAAVRLGAPGELVGASTVAEAMSGRAQVAQLALIDGEPGAIWLQDGRPRVVFAFTIIGDEIVRMDMISDPASLTYLEWELLDA